MGKVKIWLKESRKRYSPSWKYRLITSIAGWIDFGMFVLSVGMFDANLSIKASMFAHKLKWYDETTEEEKE